MAMMYWKKVVRSCRAQVARQLLYWLRGIPFTREQLSRLLRQAKERELLDEETLKMMEGVTRVTDLKVEQVMAARMFRRCCLRLLSSLVTVLLFGFVSEAI